MADRIYLRQTPSHARTPGASFEGGWVAVAAPKEKEKWKIKKEEKEER